MAQLEHLAGLFNLYTKANRGLIFSKRMRVVKAMEEAMLNEEAQILLEDGPMDSGGKPPFAGTTR